ncbi:MAG TPA: class I SAM-dependent methyltransferase [Azospirillaceae bacterium]|nr:class I SAM-dependent methyltransferase [Azospirillaceae bacterium]
MDIERLFKLHEDLPRQGPGADAVTQDALTRLKPYLPADAKVLDIGCGAGAQTMALARVTGGRIDALDVHRPYLDQLQARVKEAGLGYRVKAHEASMFDLDDFEAGSYDLIWSEGAIYIIGFADGLRRWRKWLTPGGVMAVTECSWLTDDRPQEAARFWAEGYPSMGTIDENRATAERQGYRVLDAFPLPSSAWWDGYYTPLAERVAAFREQHAGDAEWAEILDLTAMEIDLYRRFGDSYGYVFYLMRRTD